MLCQLVCMGASSWHLLFHILITLLYYGWTVQRAWPAWHHAAYLKIWFKRNADVGYIEIWGLMNVHLEVPKLIGVESHFLFKV